MLSASSMLSKKVGEQQVLNLWHDCHGPFGAALCCLRIGQDKIVSSG